MRERKSLKRAIAFLLATVLAFTTFSSDITAIAAPAGNASNLSVETTTKDGIKLTKTAALNNDGTVDITFKIDGSSVTQLVNRAANTDIILVLDASSSMIDTTNYYKSKMYKAEVAAKEFVEKVFSTEGVTDENVRIGVVSFGYDATRNVELTSKSGKQKIIYGIEHFETDNYTNIQAGIRAAREMFGEDNKNNKIVVVMSDGEANKYLKLDDEEYHSTFKVNYKGYSKKDVYLPLYDHIGSTVTGTVGNYSYEKGWNDEKGNKLNKVESQKVVGGAEIEGSEGIYTVGECKAYSVINNYGTIGYWVGNTFYNLPYSYRGSDYLTSDSKIYRYEKSTYDYEYVPLKFVVAEGGKQYYRKKVIYHDGLSAFPIVANAAVIEAQLAKNEGVKFYSIGYDIGTNAEAVYALNNIASKDEKGTILYKKSDISQLSTIFDNVATQVQEDIKAAAEGAKLVDELPTYMTPVEGNYVVSNSSNANVSDVSLVNGDINWDLSGYDLGKDKSYSITIRCDLDKDGMVSRYANDHRISSEDVLKAMSSENVSFNLNKKVTLSYTDVSGQPYENTDISIEHQNNVPTTSFKTYEYDVKYVVDGEELDVVDDRYDFDGKEITFRDSMRNSTVLAQYPESAYIYEVDKDKLTVSSSKKEAFTVNITSKEFEVKFVAKNADGTEAVVDTQTVKLGEAATDPFANATTKAQYEKAYTDYMLSVSDNNVKYDYSFSSWLTDGNNSSIDKITKAGTFTADFSSQTKKFKVTFDTTAANGAEWANAIADVAGIEYGNTVSKPTNALDDEKYPEDVESIFVKWLLNGAEYDFNTPVTGNITLVADYTITYKQVTVQFMDWEDEVFATETFKYGTTIPNYSEKTLSDKETDALIYHWTGGWVDAYGENGNGYGAASVIKSDLTLYPSFTTLENNFEVTWKYRQHDNSNWTTTTQKNVKRYETVTVTSDFDSDSFTYHGVEYIFDGWTLESDVASTVDLNNASVTETISNVTFVAKYIEDVKEYSFTFNYKDASGNDAHVTRTNLHYGDKAEAPALEDYTVVDENGDVVRTGKQTGWDNYAFLHIEGDGSAKAVEETTNHYIITFVDGFTGETLARKNVAEGDTPEVPSLPADNVNDIIKIHTTGWDSEVVAATESKTYTTTHETYIYCETVHTLDGVKFGDTFNEAWVLEGSDYTSEDNLTYPVENEGFKYERADSSALSLTGVGVDNHVLIIELKECDKSTIYFYNYDNNPVGSTTGYVGDEVKYTIPTVEASANKFAKVYTVDTWYTALENGTKVDASAYATFQATDLNLYAVETETARTFTLKFFNENEEFIKECTGLTKKLAINSAKNREAKPEKESTETKNFAGEWGTIYKTDADGNYAAIVSLEDWDYVNDNNTVVAFGTKEEFTESTRTYTVRFWLKDRSYVYPGSDLLISEQEVEYEQFANEPDSREYAYIYDNDDFAQFIGWDKDLGPITKKTDIYALEAEKHSVFYQDDKGNTVYTVTYPKFGQTSYNATILSNTDAGAKKSLGAYTYKFEGWKLGEELVEPGDEISVADKSVILKAKFEDKIPANFYVKRVWEPIFIETSDYEAGFTAGISATDANFNYEEYIKGAWKYEGRYFADDVSLVVDVEKAPAYDAFTKIENGAIDLSEKNINGSIEWYSVYVSDDGVHIEGYPSFKHDTVTVSGQYDGSNLADELFSKLADLSDGVNYDRAQFDEVFGQDLTNQTEITASLRGTLLLGEPTVAPDEEFIPVADPVETSGIVLMANREEIALTNRRPILPALQMVSVETPIELKVTARPATVTIDNKSKYTDQADPAFTYSISNLVDGDSIELMLERTAGTAAGTYTIDVASVSGNELGNYDLTINKGTFTISNRPSSDEPGPGPAPGPTPGGEDEGITPPTTPPGGPATPPQNAGGEEENEETPIITMEEPKVPLAAPKADGGSGLSIEDPDVPLAVLSHCWKHWLILGIALIYAIYATTRALQNKKELEDNEELAKNN